MSTNNTAIKAYTLRSGTLWRTDDATTVTAVTIPTRPLHCYLVKVNGTAFATGGGGGYEQSVFFSTNAAGVVSLSAPVILAAFANAATWLITYVVVGTDVQIRITGGAGVSLSWQLAVDVLEGGLTAANTGWING